MKLRVFRSLRHRDYRLFFIGQGLSVIGTWLQQTAEVWLAYRLTHSAMALGVVGFAGQIPTFFLAGLAGAWVDRADKRLFVAAAQALEMLQAFALAALVLSGRITYPLLIGFSAVGGVFDALEIPSRQAFIYDMIHDPGDLPNAIALNSSLFNVARFIGPTIAGLLIAAAGEGWCFLINGASYFAIIVSLFFMTVRSPAAPAGPRPHILRTLQEGLSYVAASVPIATLLGVLALTSLATSANSVLVPIFAAQVLGGGAHTLGFLMGASGLGALTGALTLASRESVLGLGRLIGYGIAALGVALIVFSFSSWFPLSCLAMYLVGGGTILTAASANTMIQTIVEPDKRGRVLSLFATSIVGAAPMGNFIGGALANRVGAPVTARLAGVTAIVLAAWYFRRLPQLREHIRPIYRRLGIIPEIASGLQAASTTVKPRA